MTKKDMIIELLNSYADYEIIPVWNEYDSKIYGESEIFDMSEIDDIFYGMSVSEFLDKLGANFSHYDEFFYFSIYGIESTNDIYDVIDIEELADYIIDNDDSLYDDNIAELLDSEEYAKAS